MVDVHSLAPRAKVVGEVVELAFDAAVCEVVLGLALVAQEGSVAKTNMFQSFAVLARAWSGEVLPEVFEVAASRWMMSVTDVAGRVQPIRMETRFGRTQFR